MNIFKHKQNDATGGPGTQSVISAGRRLGYLVGPDAPAWATIGWMLDEMSRRIVELEAANSASQQKDS